MSTTRRRPTFKLSPHLNQRLLALAADLSYHGELMSSRFGAQSKAWKDSEEGNTAMAWLEDLDQLTEAMTEFADAIEEPTP